MDILCVNMCLMISPVLLLRCGHDWAKNLLSDRRSCRMLMFLFGSNLADCVWPVCDDSRSAAALSAERWGLIRVPHWHAFAHHIPLLFYTHIKSFSIWYATENHQTQDPGLWLPNMTITHFTGATILRKRSMTVLVLLWSGSDERSNRAKALPTDLLESLWWFVYAPVFRVGRCSTNNASSRTVSMPCSNDGKRMKSATEDDDKCVV